MLQQTQVERVVPRYLEWLERWPTSEALAAASPADVIRAWQGLGYNRRGLNLHRAAQADRGGGWPDDLTELPGVGPYTAAAVGNFAFGRDVLPVDTNVQPHPGADRRRVLAGARRRRSWISARRSAWRASRAAGRARSLAGCPSRGRRYEPLRKQSRFEGSFRQRRARTLRLVAAAARRLLRARRGGR